MATPRCPKLWKGGDVDAFAGAEMGVSLAKLAGASEIDSIYNTEIGKVNIALAASSEVIDGNPDLVKVAIEAHKKATESLSKDKPLGSQE